MDASQHTRKVIRFPLVARTVYSWVDRGVVQRSEGRTRDISEMGTFILSRMCPPQGAQIGFKVFLPPISGYERKTRLEGDGHVLRVERPPGDEEGEGFAVLIEHIVLRLNDDIVTGEKTSPTDAS